jgi:hypothetical protein
MEAKIGKILRIMPLGDNGHDFYFKGTKDNAEIRVIAAGGHNIQCSHTRWVFIDRKQKREYEDD